MDGWENLILSLMNRGYEVFTSGSSSKILRREFSPSLRGKNITLLLLPFSFREFLKAKGFREDVRTSEGRGKVQKLLKDFLLIGGYPEVVLNDERREFLWKSYFEEIFYRDFVERYKIRSIEFGRFLLEFVFQNFSREISINRVKNFLKGKIPFTDKTLYEYVGMLEDTLNIFFVKKFSPRVYERMSWPRKIYVADLGIVNILALSEDIGRRMENLVFLELLRKTNENPMLEIYYFKSAQQREVDFALKEGVEVKQLIQVTYASSRDEVEGREIKALLKASELLKCRNLLVITWNYEDELEINGRKIRFSPLWRWLLESATYR
jgi:predicted AAA+ superfamily ATPase